MTMLTLTNDFHNTEVKLRLRGNRLSPRQVKRSARALCGIAECTCSGALGQRGEQPDALRFEQLEDGGVEVADVVSPLGEQVRYVENQRLADEIGRMINLAEGRKHARTLDRADVLCLIGRIVRGASWASTDGGAVPNSYGYSAETTAALAVRRPDGAITVGVARMWSRRVAGGGGSGDDYSVARGPWSELSPWRSSTFEDRLERWALTAAEDRVVVTWSIAEAALAALAGSRNVVVV
jgi:hypothetical protein